MTDFDLESEDGVLEHARYMVSSNPLPTYYAMDESENFYAYGYVGMGEWDAVELSDARARLLRSLVSKDRLVVEREINLYGLRLRLLVPGD